MRLRTYESFWLLKNGLLYSYPSLRENLEAELVVVGGGITGALISHALCEKGYDVLLLDKRDIGHGSTSATTSMLQYEIDTPLYELADMIGEEAAVLCYQAGIEAIENLEKLVKKHKIDCGFERKKSLYMAHNAKAAKWLKEDEFEIRKKHGFAVEWLTPAEAKKRYSVNCHGAILSDVAASVDAYTLAHELIAQNVKKKKLRVYDQTPIAEFKPDKNGVEILLEEGPTVKCKKVIFCTGFESTEMLKEDIVDLLDSYATVSEREIQMPKIFHDTLIWDTGDPYLYMRTTAEGRLLVGGEDTQNTFGWIRQKRKASKASTLKDKVEKLVDKLEFIEDFSWAGTFGETKDGLPYIGISNEFENGIWVLGFGGNGITFSVQGMDLVPHLMEGTLHPLLNYYRFGR